MCPPSVYPRRRGGGSVVLNRAFGNQPSCRRLILYFLAKCYDFALRCNLRCATESCPFGHNEATAVEQVATAIGRLHLIAYGMRHAISATSLGKFVRSAAQSRNVERKPRAVRSPRFIRRNSH